MERKHFEIDLSKAIKLDKGEGSAIIAELNVEDHDGDVTLPGAFGIQNVNMLPAHDRMAPRLGKATLKEVDGVAIADFKFNLDKDAITAREWYATLKFDIENGPSLIEWSYGFDILDSSFGEFEGKQVRFLRSLKVHEISPVLKGAGIGTGTLAIKEQKNQTFADDMKTVVTSLAEVKALLTRTESLAELRAKDGRSLSAEKQEGLKSICALLDEVQEGFGDLLLKCDGDDRSLDMLFAEYQHNLIVNKHLLGD